VCVWLASGVSRIKNASFGLDFLFLDNDLSRDL
jgi:hypothetical protein